MGTYKLYVGFRVEGLKFRVWVQGIDKSSQMPGELRFYTFYERTSNPYP